MVAILDGERGYRTKDDSGQVWFKLDQWFQRRRFLKSLQTDDGCQVMAIAHTGELKSIEKQHRRTISLFLFSSSS